MPRVITRSFPRREPKELWDITLNNWSTQSTRAVGTNPHGVSIGDANNDGQNDIVVANYDDNSVSILLWNSPRSDWIPEITRKVGRYPRSVSIADANNDGKNEIVTAIPNDNIISLLSWDSTNNNGISRNRRT